MSQNLYQEAIAEAKKLKEVAEQNAKNAIVEAVTPKIREFIEMQLVNNESYSGDQDVLSESLGLDSGGDEITLSESSLGTLLELAAGSDFISEEMKQVKNRSIITKALNESVGSMTNEERKKLSKIADKLKEQAKNLDPNSIIKNQSIKTNVSEEYDNMSGNDTLYEVNLNSLIASLNEAVADEGDDVDELHMDEADQMEEMEKMEEGHPYEGDGHGEVSEAEIDEMSLDELDIILKGLPDEAKDMIDLSQLSLEFLDDEGDDAGAEGEGEMEFEMPGDEEDDAPEGDEAPVEDEGGEEPLEEVFDIDLADLKKEIRRLAESSGLATMGKKNKMAHAFGGNASDHPSGESFGGGKRGKDPLQVKIRDAVRLAEAVKTERRRNRSLSAKLSKYESAVESLREQLTEMNLFNAKLLYVNKLLQNGSMSSSQRRSIIESLDDAKSLREVKLLYRSLTESIAKPSGQRGNINESTARRALGSSSRAMAGSTPKNAESNELNRWAKLAGIEK